MFIVMRFTTQSAPLGAASEFARMANTYSQIYLRVVFAVSERACVILPNRKAELQKYLTGIADAS